MFISEVGSGHFQSKTENPRKQTKNNKWVLKSYGIVKSLIVFLVIVFTKIK